MANISKYTILLTIPMLCSMLSSCGDETEKLPDYPKVLEVAASSMNNFDGDGGQLKVLVNTNIEYEIDIDVDWITAVKGSRSERPVNGCIFFNVEQYRLAATAEPRVGTITLMADGVKPQILPVSQTPADIYRFDITGVTPGNVSAKGGTVEVTVDANVSARVSVSDSEWISVAEESAGRYVFDISENTVTQPRSGAVTFSTDEIGDFMLEIVQDAHVETGGIRSAEQFMLFAAAVNSGEPLTQWLDGNGEVALLADIDMAGQTWTPVGDITEATISYTTLSITAGKPFTGIFNGNGHSIRNLSIDTDRGPCFGLFGACENAIIKNLVIDKSCTFKVANEALTGGAAYGFVVGIAVNSTLENVMVEGRVLPSLIYKSKTGYLNCLSGVAGYVKHSTLRDCVFSGTFDMVRSNVYHNSACSNVAGIVGYAFGSKDALISIERCVNRGYVCSRTNRTAGIVSGSNGSYVIRDCRNEGVVHGSSADAKSIGWTGGVRVGGILAFALCKSTDGTTAEIIGCENTGTVLCDGDKGSMTGGILGCPRHHTLVSATNSGTVIATGGGDVGLITGRYAYSDKPIIQSATCGGRIAYDFTGEGISIIPQNPIEITRDNYFDYAVGAFAGTADGSWTKDTVSFVR